MKSICKFLAIACLFFSLTLEAHTINKVGNGGDVISCKESGKSDVKLLDFYEADLSPQSAEADPFKVAAQKIDLIKEIAPRLHDIYSKRLKNLNGEIDYKADVELTDIPDSKHLFVPAAKDCKVLQIAIRKAKVDGTEKRFLIQKSLWDQLNSANKAGLLIHEIIYEHLSKMGEEDSRKARKINAYIFNDKIDKKEFWNYITKLEVPLYP